MEDYVIGLLIALIILVLTVLGYSAKMGQLVRDHRQEIDALQKSLLPGNTVANSVIDAAQAIADVK